ncbi:MAG: DUF4260 domain-containing protein [Polyangiaceae bacterium]|nr:DUF4260 domain-containing protein [Polyangiaceae bacterium]
MDNVNAFTAPTVSTSDAHVSAAQPAIFASRFLRIEGLLLLLVSSVAYRHLGGSWALFAVLFLVPDVSLLGYLGGARFGAWAYNLGHSTLLPLLLAGLGWFVSAPMLLLLALIWTAHIGFDRLMGYGLKQTSGFRDTHLGRIGHDA